MNIVNKEKEYNIIRIVLGILLIFMALNVVGCSLIGKKIVDDITQKGVDGISGVLVDVSLLLAKAESQNSGLQRVVIAFNGNRYNPWDCGWTSARRKSPGPPFKKLYHLDLQMNLIRGRHVTFTVQMDLPGHAQGVRIPVQVVSFSDVEEKLPLAKVEGTYIKGGQSYTDEYWFEYASGDWTRPRPTVPGSEGTR